jgi:hypothetical protein
MRSYAGTYDFITNMAARFPNLEVRYKQGQTPRLLLEGEKSTTVDIQKFSSSEIANYLQNNVE